MKNKSTADYSGITVCDSIVMSVKNKRKDLRKIESVFIALIGFIAVIISFLEMFSFNYNISSIIKAALFFSVIYITVSLIGKKAIWFFITSLIILCGMVYKFFKPLADGFKFTYNVIYSDSYHTQIKYYKFLKPEQEEYCITLFFIFCIWLLALVIYFFTIYKPNPVIVVLCTFPIIEIGLYNGIAIPIFWGILTIAYWLALLAICNIDLGEFSGGSGGFVRKENLFFPKRQMRFKVTEKCAIFIVISIAAVTALTLAAMKITGYKRSDNLNQRRTDIKEAINAFTFDDLATSISVVTESFGFTFSYESHKLGTNDHIKYKNVTDLVVTTDKEYSGAIYLKGYAGAIYNNNEWFDLDEHAYKNAKELFNDFDEYNIYPQYFPHTFLNHDFLDNTDLTIWVDAKRKKNKSYAPYATDNDDDLEYKNDTIVSSKKNNSNEYSYKFIGMDVNKVYNLMLTPTYECNINTENITDANLKKTIDDYCLKYDLYSSGKNFSVTKEDVFGDTYIYDNADMMLAPLLENRYRDFVHENYLQVPENENINEVYNEFSDLIADAQSASTAAEKIDILYKIRDRINSMTEYSLSPGKTPANRDFINYFLLENHKGYCTHYASSGVILARMAGIPARYATGYIVVGDDFNTDTRNEDGSYTIELQDNRSHAWTEIYLDGFGWLPFEFTAGYSSMSIDTSTSTSVETTTEQTRTSTVTPASDTSSVSKTSNNSSKTSSLTSNTTTNTTAVSGIKKADTKDSRLTETIKDIILYFAVIVILTLLIYLRRYIIIRKRENCFNTGEINSRILYIYNYTEKLLNFIGVKNQNIQYTDFADSVENRFGARFFESGDFNTFMNIVLQNSFSQEIPDVENYQFVLKFSDNLSRRIYEGSNVFKKIYLKIIVVLI